MTKKEDPAWRVRMPPEQTAKFNEYIALMSGVNRGLGRYLVVLAMISEKLSLRVGWLCEAALWAMATMTVRDYLATETKEPVIESEHREKVEQARAEWVPVADLADTLAYDHTDWREEDAEGRHPDGSLIISEEAWERVCKEKERELAKLVAVI